MGARQAGRRGRVIDCTAALWALWPDRGWAEDLLLVPGGEGGQLGHMVWAWWWRGVRRCEPFAARGAAGAAPAGWEERVCRRLGCADVQQAVARALL